ncbi:cell division protein Fic [Rhodomicrobium udaipurense JA643]|uniref:Fic family protein n=1 Tax=Rhodomicrobium udaipurense TaxID=1202716 RepID=A0A8I1KL66_9HYPH|nr:Fic/DOC family N-terminal domain-containing protein [Rhodomicrobium udaipurense]KAI93670.1 cell division protein Fic [Rhodomicrobium udaipurense JA643]MBJ7544989.1 Fic family protein [Rhodomicrobium udaipurense]
MNREEFAESPSGTLVPTERDQWAFLPNDLPPSGLDMGRLALPLEKASQLLGELNGIGRVLPNPYILIRPLQTREALTSSSMEGTYTTIDDLLLLEAGASEHPDGSDTREVSNYRRALSAAIDSLEKLPLSIRTLKDAHRTLLRGVARHRGHVATPGEFKRHQNFIGGKVGLIENARFIPPPPKDALIALETLEKYIHRDNRLGIPDLIDAALIHYQFETIHPFSDGNGRVGRMLITLHLYMRGAIRQPILYLSPVFEKRKDEYIDLMFNVSRSGKWEDWIAFFLDVVCEACQSAITTSEALLRIQEKYRVQAGNAGRSSKLMELTDYLFSKQVVSIPMVAEFLNVQYRSAKLHVEKLVDIGVLKEIPTWSNPKFFIAHEIRDIILTSLK